MFEKPKMNLDIVSRQDYAVPTYRETDGDHHVTARVVDMAARDLFGAKPSGFSRPPQSDLTLLHPTRKFPVTPFTWLCRALFTNSLYRPQ